MSFSAGGRSNLDLSVLPSPTLWKALTFLARQSKSAPASTVEPVPCAEKILDTCGVPSGESRIGAGIHDSFKDGGMLRYMDLQAGHGNADDVMLTRHARAAQVFVLYMLGGCGGTLYKRNAGGACVAVDVRPGAERLVKVAQVEGAKDEILPASPFFPTIYGTQGTQTAKLSTLQPTISMGPEQAEAPFQVDVVAQGTNPLITSLLLREYAERSCDGVSFETVKDFVSRVKTWHQQITDPMLLWRLHSIISPDAGSSEDDNSYIRSGPPFVSSYEVTILALNFLLRLRVQRTEGAQITKWHVGNKDAPDQQRSAEAVWVSVCRRVPKLKAPGESSQKNVDDKSFLPTSSEGSSMQTSLLSFFNTAHSLYDDELDVQTLTYEVEPVNQDGLADELPIQGGQLSAHQLFEWFLQAYQATDDDELDAKKFSLQHAESLVFTSNELASLGLAHSEERRPDSEPRGSDDRCESESTGPFTDVELALEDIRWSQAWVSCNFKEALRGGRPLFDSFFELIERILEKVNFAAGNSDGPSVCLLMDYQASAKAISDAVDQVLGADGRMRVVKDPFPDYPGYFTMDNRRLFVLKMMLPPESRVRVKLYSTSEAYTQGNPGEHVEYKFATKTLGESVGVKLPQSKGGLIQFGGSEMEGFWEMVQEHAHAYVARQAAQGRGSELGARFGQRKCLSNSVIIPPEYGPTPEQQVGPNREEMEAIKPAGEKEKKRSCTPEREKAAKVRRTGDY